MVPWYVHVYVRKRVYVQRVFVAELLVGAGAGMTGRISRVVCFTVVDSPAADSVDEVPLEDLRRLRCVMSDSACVWHATKRSRVQRRPIRRVGGFGNLCDHTHTAPTVTPPSNQQHPPPHRHAHKQTITRKRTP
jgi:hypothetical protein